MTQYLVRCRNAAGTPRDLAILARSSSQACRQALRQLETDYAGEGWIAEFVL
jgi:hypothetical protein